MEHKWNISRRKRGLLGALIGAAIPFGLGMYEHGPFYQWGGDIWLFIGGIGTFVAVLGAGVVMGREPIRHRHSNGSEIEADMKWPDHDRNDFIDQTGIYTSSREVWDQNYQRNSWD